MKCKVVVSRIILKAFLLAGIQISICCMFKVNSSLNFCDRWWDLIEAHESKRQVVKGES